MQLINGAPRQHECSPGLRSVMKAPSRGEDFIPDGPTQYHVQEVMYVLVVRNDTRRNLVILDCETSPLDRRAAQRRTCMQECLEATLANDFDSANNRPIERCPVRNVHASNSRNWTQAGMSVRFRADFERISEDLHSFGVLELHTRVPEHMPAINTRIINTRSKSALC